MATLKDLRRRIRATKSMQQIFKAMEMVAAAKFRRAQGRAQAASPYAQKITEMLGNLAGAASELEHPLFKVRPVKTTALVVISADRGFAGTYNTSILRVAEHRIRDVRDELKEGDQLLVKVIGIDGQKVKLSRKAVLREQREKKETARS